MAGSSQTPPRPEPRKDETPDTGARTPPPPTRKVVFSDWASI